MKTAVVHTEADSCRRRRRLYENTKSNVPYRCPVFSNLLQPKIRGSESKVIFPRKNSNLDTENDETAEMGLQFIIPLDSPRISPVIWQQACSFS